MALPDHVREPCPDRIVDDVGGAFSMGAVGGSVFHFLKGSKNSPKGERILGGVQAVRMNAPRVGGSFAVWGGLFSSFDCMFVYIRQKEDPWNSIAAGAATGGFLQVRAGLNSATRAAIFGGVILALIEGAGIMLNRLSGPPPPPLDEQIPSGYGGNPAANRAALPGVNPGFSAGNASKFPTTQHAFGGSNKEADGQAIRKADGLDLSTATQLPGFGGVSSSLPATDSGLYYPEFSKEKQAEKSKGKSSWLGGWFASKKQHDGDSSFEANPAPPVPSFEIK